MSGVHRAAAVGFARSADAYERGRPEYPDAAVSYVVAALPAGAVVLDLAAGTGKLTRPLLAAGLEVIAVEPVAEMRATLPAGARALEGTAEAIPLQDAAVDAVTVGQAFHWFDGPSALAEIERVLRPGGGLALVWNRRPVESSELHAAISAIMAPYRGDAPAHASGAWRDAFAGRELTEWTFAFAQTLDGDGLADRVGSTSFIAALEEGERSGVLERVRALAGEGAVAVPYVCEIHLWRPR